VAGDAGDSSGIICVIGGIGLEILLRMYVPAGILMTFSAVYGIVMLFLDRSDRSCEIDKT